MSQWAGRIERMTQTSIDTNVYSEAEQGNDHLKDLHLVVKIILNWNLLTYLLTCSMEKSPSLDANRFSATQEIPHTLGNTKVHYRIHK